MYIPGKDRYANYTTRSQVYFFTLRDYCEMLNIRYGGTYIERSDMPIHSGYLIFFTKADDAKNFIAAQATSSTEVSEDVTAYVLPHTDGNELPVYATVKEGVDIIYIGLSEYADALEIYQPGEAPAPVVETVQIAFAANGGTGTMDPNPAVVTKNVAYEVPACAFTAPEGKVFDNWGDKESDPTITYEVGEEITPTANMLLIAQWKDA